MFTMSCLFRAPRRAPGCPPRRKLLRGSRGRRRRQVGGGKGKFEGQISPEAHQNTAGRQTDGQEQERDITLSRSMNIPEGSWSLRSVSTTPPYTAPHCSALSRPEERPQLPQSKPGPKLTSKFNIRPPSP
uniref:Uncharacterized protein n=1 Tax=Knipowitschia caucasica TaxID=637954 RepID=A0AAV2J932_KNICA